MARRLGAGALVLGVTGGLDVCAGSSGALETAFARAQEALGHLPEPDVDQAASALQGRGLNAASGPGQAGPVRYAFFDDPNGVRIELVTHAR